MTAFTREFYLSKIADCSPVKITEKVSGAIAYIYTRAGHPCVMAFAPKATKPTLYLRFSNEAARERQVREFIGGYKARAARVAAERAEMNRPHRLEVGHILRSSWGYEQTNIDFYQVVATTARTVDVRKIAQVSEETSWCVGRCLPKADEFTGPAKRYRASGRNSVKLNSYAVATIWEGKPEQWTAYA